MGYQLVNIVFLSTIGLACGLALEEMLGLYKTEKRWQRIFLWWSGFLVVAISLVYEMIICSVLLVPVIYWGYRLYSDVDSSKKAIQQILLAILLFVFSYPVTRLIVKNHISFDFSSRNMIFVVVLGVTIVYVSIYFAMNKWNKKYNGYVKRSNIWIFGLILASEIAGVNRTVHMADIGQAVRILIMQCFIDIAIFLIMYDLVSKERMENELKQLKYYMDCERAYYQEMDKEREEMAKIRHDYNNQLTSVLGLIHMNRLDEAKEMLKEMEDKVYD